MASNDCYVKISNGWKSKQINWLNINRSNFFLSGDSRFCVATNLLLNPTILSVSKESTCIGSTMTKSCRNFLISLACTFRTIFTWHFSSLCLDFVGMPLVHSILSSRYHIHPIRRSIQFHLPLYTDLMQFIILPFSLVAATLTCLNGAGATNSCHFSCRCFSLSACRCDKFHRGYLSSRTIQLLIDGYTDDSVKRH